MTTHQLSERETKALEIAAHTKLTRKGKFWIVPSQSGTKQYTVEIDSEPRVVPVLTLNRSKHDASISTQLRSHSRAKSQTTTRLRP
jgi:hypothetical protein